MGFASNDGKKKLTQNILFVYYLAGTMQVGSALGL